MSVYVRECAVSVCMAYTQRHTLSLSLSLSLSHTQQSKDMMRECGATLLLGDSHTLKELGKDVDPSMPPVYISLVFFVCAIFFVHAQGVRN